MIDPDDLPDADEPASEPAAAGGKAQGPKNEQFASLNRLRRERTWVDVYLIGGTCLHGQIRSFDPSMMLLQTRSGDVALYHHAISTVVRGQKRGGNARAKRRSGFESHQGSGGPPPRRPMSPQLGGLERDYPRDEEPGSDGPDASPRRAPVVIVKQRKTRSYTKPD